MKIRTKILLLIFIFLFTLSAILSLTFWTMRNSATLSQIIEKENKLTQDSYRVYSQMKDLVFAGLSPEIYRFIKGHVYMPSFNTVYKTWVESTVEFQESFLAYMESKELNGLMNNVQLRNEYNIIMTLSANAFLKIQSLIEKFTLIRSSEIITLSESSYIEFLIQDNESLDEFLDELRSTSIYLSTNLESYLQPFFTKIEMEAQILQKRIFWIFGIVAFSLVVLMTIFATMLLRRIIKQINQVNDYFVDISTGNFSTQLNSDSNDEFGKLFNNLNKLIADLKGNTNTVLKLMNDIQGTALPNLDLSGVLHLIVKSAVDETIADSAAILVFDDTNKELIVEEIEGVIPMEILHYGSESNHPSDILMPSLRDSGEGMYKKQRISIDNSIFHDVVKTGEPFFTGSEELMQYDGISSLLINPLLISGRVWGLLCVICIEKQHQFTDLNFTQLTTYAGYSSLFIDNYMKYVELIGKKEAQYRALQSQIQPHFLFNILNGFIGLNRLGERDSLEKTILALRGMLRYTLDHDEWTTVRDEFKFLQEYCDLQQMRFDSRFAFSITLDDEIADFRVPKLIVQPLVENAVIHGIEPLDRVGNLQISASVEFRNSSKYLKIVVQDDGAGFEMDELNQNKRVGLSNIEERLSIAFSSASFTINSIKDKQTSSVILINMEESLHENTDS